MSLINWYLINQVVDILLWGWVLLIMIKRVCNMYKSKYYSKHFWSSSLFLLASILAVTQFTDQFYGIITHTRVLPTTLYRTIIWMIFQKLITGSILIKYKNSQPRLFHNIKQEILYLHRLLFKFKADKINI